MTKKNSHNLLSKLDIKTTISHVLSELDVASGMFQNVPPDAFAKTAKDTYKTVHSALESAFTWLYEAGEDIGDSYYDYEKYGEWGNNSLQNAYRKLSLTTNCRDCMREKQVYPLLKLTDHVPKNEKKTPDLDWSIAYKAGFLSEIKKIVNFYYYKFSDRSHAMATRTAQWAPDKLTTILDPELKIPAQPIGWSEAERSERPVLQPTPDWHYEWQLKKITEHVIREFQELLKQKYGLLEEELTPLSKGFAQAHIPKYDDQPKGGTGAPRPMWNSWRGKEFVANPLAWKEWVMNYLPTTIYAFSVPEDDEEFGLDIRGMRFEEVLSHYQVLLKTMRQLLRERSRLNVELSFRDEVDSKLEILQNVYIGLFGFFIPVYGFWATLATEVAVEAAFNISDIKEWWNSEEIGDLEVRLGKASTIVREYANCLTSGANCEKYKKELVTSHKEYSLIAEKLWKMVPESKNPRGSKIYPTSGQEHWLSPSHDSRLSRVSSFETMMQDLQEHGALIRASESSDEEVQGRLPDFEFGQLEAEFERTKDLLIRYFELQKEVVMIFNKELGSGNEKRGKGKIKTMSVPDIRPPGEISSIDEEKKPKKKDKEAAPQKDDKWGSIDKHPLDIWLGADAGSVQGYDLGTSGDAAWKDYASWDQRSAAMAAIAAGKDPDNDNVDDPYDMRHDAGPARKGAGKVGRGVRNDCRRKAEEAISRMSSFYGVTPNTLDYVNNQLDTYVDAMGKHDESSFVRIANWAERFRQRMADEIYETPNPSVYEEDWMQTAIEQGLPKNLRYKHWEVDRHFALHRHVVVWYPLNVWSFTKGQDCGADLSKPPMNESILESGANTLCRKCEDQLQLCGREGKRYLIIGKYFESGYGVLGTMIYQSESFSTKNVFKVIYQDKNPPGMQSAVMRFLFTWAARIDRYLCPLESYLDTFEEPGAVDEARLSLKYQRFLNIQKKALQLFRKTFQESLGESQDAIEKAKHLMVQTQILTLMSNMIEEGG